MQQSGPPKGKCLRRIARAAKWFAIGAAAGAIAAKAAQGMSDRWEAPRSYRRIKSSAVSEAIADAHNKNLLTLTLSIRYTNCSTPPAQSGWRTPRASRTSSSREPLVKEGVGPESTAK